MSNMECLTFFVHYRISNHELSTLNVKHWMPHNEHLRFENLIIEFPTMNVKHWTSDIKLQTLNSMWNIESWTSYVKYRTLHILNDEHWTSNVERRTSNVERRTSNVDRKWDIGNLNKKEKRKTRRRVFAQKLILIFSFRLLYIPYFRK